MTRETFGLQPDTWEVIGTLLSGGALLIGAVAALIAALEYRMGREARQDQTRPYMTVTAEASPASNHLIDIVIKNVGATPAHDLEIEVDPPFLEARPDEHSLSRARIFNERVEMWPPGYEIRAFFDSHIERNGKDLPATHSAKLTYGDGRGNRWSENVMIDLDLQIGLTYIETFGMHHVAKALREMAKVVTRADLLKKSHLNVTTETRDQLRTRTSEERSARRSRLEELRSSTPGPQPEGSGE